MRILVNQPLKPFVFWTVPEKGGKMTVGIPLWLRCVGVKLAVNTQLKITVVDAKS